MLHLTGPPKLNGYVLPRPDLGAPLEGAWDGSESRTREYRDGSVEVVEYRLRGTFRLGWRHIDRDTAAVVIAELAQPDGAVLVPRSKASTDPEWAEEVALPVRCVSELPAIARLSTERVELMVELVTRGVFSFVPGTVYGGWYAEAVAGGVTLTPYGQATLEPGAEPYEVSFLGLTYPLTPLTLGTPALTALRTRPVSGRVAPTLQIDTREGPAPEPLP